VSAHYLFLVLLIVWFIFALPFAIWLSIWDVRSALKVKDETSMAWASREQRFQSTAKFGGPAVLAVIVGVVVNLGSDAISSGDTLQVLWGSVAILMSVIVAMFGSAGVTWLVYSTQYAPNSFSTIRADIIDAISGHREPNGRIDVWREAIERVQGRMVADAFGLFFRSTKNESALRDILAQTKMIVPEEPSLRDIVLPSRALRVSNSAICGAFRRTWRFRAVGNHWFSIFSGAVALSSVQALLDPNWTTFDRGIIVGIDALVFLTAIVWNKFHSRAVTVGAARRYSVYEKQLSDCLELLDSYVTQEEGRKKPAPNQLQDRGAIRRLWAVIW
jgi:hypothetical protein